MPGLIIVIACHSHSLGNDTLKMPRSEVTVRQVLSRQQSNEQCNNSFQEEVCQRNLLAMASKAVLCKCE